jgi:hypothetical protein
MPGSLQNAISFDKIDRKMKKIFLSMIPYFPLSTFNLPLVFCGRRMKKIFLIFILCFPLSTFNLPPSHAAFDEVGVGARAVGMGGAFVGLADSIYAVYYNPAGLCLLKSLEVAGEGALLYKGLDDASNINSSFGALGLPVKGKFSLGFNYSGLALADVYSEKVVEFSAGVPLARNLYAGFGVKSLSQEFVLNGYYSGDSVFAKGNSGAANDCDFGLLARPLRGFSLGLGVAGITQGAYGLENGTGARLPRRVTFGMALQGRDMNFVMDTAYRQYDNSGAGTYSRDLRLRAGIEKWLFPRKSEDGYTVALRAGIGWDLGQLLIPSSDRGYRSISLGFGLNLGPINLDYGFVLPLGGLEDINGTHRFSFLVKYGKIYKNKALADTGWINPAAVAPVREQSVLLGETGMGVAVSTVSVPASRGSVSLQSVEKPLPEKITAAEKPEDRIKRILAGSSVINKIKIETVPVVSTGTVTEGTGKVISSTTAAKAVIPGTAKKVSVIPEVRTDTGTVSGEENKIEEEAVSALPPAPQTGPSAGKAGTVSEKKAPGKEEKAPENIEVKADTGTIESAVKKAAEANIQVEEIVSTVTAARQPVAVAPQTGPSAEQEQAKKEKPVLQPEDKERASRSENKGKAADRGEHTVQPRTYRVEAGDTLVSLAKRFYGNERQWVIIYEANRESIGKGVIKPGQVLLLPERGN